MNMGLRRSRSAPSRESLQVAKDVIRRETAGFNAGMGLAVEPDRLSESEQTQLVELVNQAGKGRSWAWSRLSPKERRDLEGLIEKGSDQRGAFDGARSIEEIRAMTEQARVAAVRRPFSKREERGIFSEIGVGIEARSLNAADVALIATVVTAFVNGRATGPRTRVERVGEMSALVIEDANLGGVFGGQFDDEQQLAPRWKQSLQWLEEIDWFEVSRNGKQWTIKPGTRLRGAMAGLRSAA